jgi:hypothetical protein
VSDDDRPPLVRNLSEIRTLPDIELYNWLLQAREAREDNPAHLGLDLLIEAVEGVASQRARAAWDAQCADMRAAGTDDNPPFCRE